MRKSRKSSQQNVGAATPTKICKREPNVNVQKNISCRFCGDKSTSGGGRASLENLFSPSRRVESAGLILAHCCGSIGLRLTRNDNLSERVCRPCGRKFTNAAELYSLIEKAVSNTNIMLRKIYIERLWEIEAKDSFPPLSRQ